MDTDFVLRGLRFCWDADKAATNVAKHGVSFEHAAEIFLDPFVTLNDASRNSETRDAALGVDFGFRVLFVVHMIVEDDYIRIISARKAEAFERKHYEDGNT